MPKYQVFDADGNLIDEWETPDEPDPVAEVAQRIEAAEERLNALTPKVQAIEARLGDA